MSPLRAVFRSTQVLRLAVAALSAAFLATAPAAHAAHADTSAQPADLSGRFVIANANQHMVLCADPNSTMATVEPLTLTIDPYCVWKQGGDDSDLIMYNAAKDMVLGINKIGPFYNGETVDLMPLETSNGYEHWKWGVMDSSGLIGLPLLALKDQSFNLNAHDGAGNYVTITDAYQPTRPDQSWTTVSVSVSG
ncbi:hypothetical protein [Streptomyces sp. NPDC101234]|uniref:hypothetical protein n=1 Tax=Streptomyces sp. NPDC101234 TaxID=3366138 RepID=UPI0038179C2D